jgi:peptidoglycan-associated lipoprotein
MKTLTPLKTLVIPSMLFLGACCCTEDVVVAPKPAPVPVPVVVPAPPPPPAPVPVPVVVPTPVVVPPAPAQQLGDIYFDFDKSVVRKDAVPELKKVAAWLKANPTKGVVAEAHADEKGTSQYNIALGQRRADAAKKYLVKLGVNPARIKAVSYGKDKPLVAGSNDKAWAKNRVIHFSEAE